MPTYKLSYFNGKGRGETARLMFVASGKEYEDERLAGEKWMEFKPKTPYGQMPVLTVDGGKMINQSGAICRFLARELDLYGKNYMENTMCDVIVETVAEVTTDKLKFFFEKDEVKKAEGLKNFEENVLPKFFKFVTKVLQDNGGEFLVGGKLSLADLAVFDAIDRLTSDPKTGHAILKDYSALKDHIEKIGKIPGIKKYLETRPKTDF